MSYPPADEEMTGVCPYLGLADDADSHATYPTEAHRCYRLDNPTRIAANHQESYCLGENHVGCPVYKGDGIGAAAPAAAAAAAGAGATPRGRGAGRPPREPKPLPGRAPRAAAGAAAGERPLRKPPTGSIGPRPRAGGISMPVATAGLFALAIVVVALAFFLQSALDDDGGGSLTPAQVNATNQAAKPTTAAPQQTTAGGTTVPGTGTPGAGTTPGASTTPRTGTPTSGAKEYEVVSGDTCGAIGEKTGIDYRQILAKNGLTEDSCTRLQVGQKLLLP
ncbi:MAG TPA: LysM peptidoglycan-binding domain-containing protein [Tepidiformaceae bacterium]|nr:LysM peptidoglycan-binding domain-containing protein [Tepidiformaceae bacterium]